MSDLLPADDPGTAERLADELRAGLLVVVPTDTTYALAADAFTPSATRRLMRARASGRNRPLPVAIRTPYQVGALAEDVSEAAQTLMDALWPGPLTLILPAAPRLAADLGNTRGTVQLRMPADDVLAEVIRRVGPLALTGAHRRGEEGASTAEEARVQLGRSVAAYADAGTLEGPRSTIVDARGETVVVLREGAITGDELREILGHDRVQDVSEGPGDQPGDEGSAGQPAADSDGQPGEESAQQTPEVPDREPAEGSAEEAAADPEGQPAGDPAGSADRVDGHHDAPSSEHEPEGSER